MIEITNEFKRENRSVREILKALKCILVDYRLLCFRACDIELNSPLGYSFGDLALQHVFALGKFILVMIK